MIPLLNSTNLDYLKLACELMTYAYNTIKTLWELHEREVYGTYTLHLQIQASRSDSDAYAYAMLVLTVNITLLLPLQRLPPPL